MSRCHICDATSDGKLSQVPFKRSRTITPDRHKPWLDTCSDCTVFGKTDFVLEDILDGEIPNVEFGWDND